MSEIREVVGNTMTTPMPQSDWTQTDEKRADYIKNKPEILSREELVQVVIEALSQYNGEGGTNSFFGQKMYSFGVLSDIHLTDEGGRKGYNFKEGVDDFNRAIPALQKLGAEFVCISGDIGYDSRTEELELFKNAVKPYKDTMPFYACTGNHDWSHDDTNWNTYVGHPLKHVFVHEGDVFIFMSEYQSSEKAENLLTPYGTDCIDWLKKQFDDYKGARIFVFMHYPLYPYAGLRDNTNYGYSPDSTEDDAILSAALATKNVVIFSGHTHYKFDCEAEYDTINTYNFQHNRVTLAHVPSCAYPRNKNHGEVDGASEGYIVEVYEKGFVLRGVNLVDGTYMPDYEYAYPADNNPVVADSTSIVLSDHSVSLKSRESVEVKVSLSKLADITVSVTQDNDFVTVTPTSLEFSKDDTYKTITITAGDIDVDAMSVITLSADDVTPKEISVALVDETPEEEPPKEETVTEIGGVITLTTADNGTVYGTVSDGWSGAYGTKCQLYTDKNTTGKFNFTFRNLKLRSSNTALYMAGDSETTVYLEGSNTLDTSGTSVADQRVISSSGTNGNYLIGEDENAELILIGPSDHEKKVIKGDWTIKDARVAVTGTTAAGYEGVEVINTGITLYNSGEFSINGSTVKLIACDGGTLTVNLGSAIAGTSTLEIASCDCDDCKNSGYTLSAIKVNGEEQPVDTTITMPATGEIEIQGVFSK